MYAYIPIHFRQGPERDDFRHKAVILQVPQEDCLIPMITLIPPPADVPPTYRPASFLKSQHFKPNPDGPQDA